MSVTFKDYYEILGLKRDASDSDIKAAYRKLARKWHPDLHIGKDKEEAEEKFKKINEAYEVLKDSEKRAKYDRLGKNWRTGDDFRPPPDMDGSHFYTNVDGASGFSDFFETLFGGGDPFGRGARGRRTGGSMRGQDAESELEITLEEAYRGGDKTLQLASRDICANCGGSGHDGNSFCSGCGGTGVRGATKTLTVKIPPGIRQSGRIRLKGQGGDGLGGGPKGDLYLKINIAPHPVFKLNGDDLETEVALRPEQAVLGDQVTVPTLDGNVQMKVPAGTRAGRRMRLRGKGMPRAGGRGDQYVVVKIDIPENITPQEEQLYHQLADLRKGV